MRLIKHIRSAAVLMAVTTTATTFAEQTAENPQAFNFDYEAEAIFNGGSGNGKFAPYYIASNRHGILTQKGDALLRLSAVRPLSTATRFSYGFGVEAVGGWSSKTAYSLYDAEAQQMTSREVAPSALWLQQLYGEVKWRGVFLTVGLKQQHSALLNFGLSSGDLVESGNARPIPEVRIGFIDFQDIPFTNGWVQIQGEISYGKFTDNSWWRDHFNYYSGHINLGGLYTYKRCYFRTKPSQPFSLTIGMQVGGLFGGTTSYYRNGALTKQEKWSTSLEKFFKMFLPIQNSGSAFYDGNSLGSWDLHLRYRLADGTSLKAYAQKPWEDGSGIGCMNGFDGLWGLEYESANPDAIISGAVIEYLDFTNQSGPIHWSTSDSPGTTITSHATGGDEYYNNAMSNSYCNYGMSIGTPFLRSPLYNLDGYPAYVDNCVRGFHAALTGRLSPSVTYRLMGGYRKGWGDSRIPTSTSRHDTSMMLEAAWTPTLRLDGKLRVKGQVAFDAGNMYGNSFGACVSVAYTGNLH